MGEKTPLKDPKETSCLSTCSSRQVCSALASVACSSIKKCLNSTGGKILLLIIVELYLLTHYGLWITHYGLFTQNVTHVYREKIETGSYPHVVLCVWAVCIALFDALQYIQFAFGYILREKEDKNGSPNSDSWCAACTDQEHIRSCCGPWFYTSIAVLILLLLGGAKVALAILMENEKANPDQVYRVYCLLEIGHITLDIVLRAFMFRVMYKIKKEWTNKTTQNNSHQSSGSLSQGGSEDGTVSEAGRAFLKELQDYHDKGRKVKHLLYPFTIWFLTPWIVYLLITSINPHYLLAPWTDAYSRIHDLSRAFHLINLAYRTLLLLLQYAFALKVNQYHRDYYIKMRHRVIFESGRDQKYRLEASQMMDNMYFHDDFNFYPTFLSINPRIAVDGPLYVIFLVLGVIVNTSDKLFHLDSDFD